MFNLYALVLCRAYSFITAFLWINIYLLLSFDTQSEISCNPQWAKVNTWLVTYLIKKGFPTPTETTTDYKDVDVTILVISTFLWLSITIVIVIFEIRIETP